MSALAEFHGRGKLACLLNYSVIYEDADEGKTRRRRRRAEEESSAPHDEITADYMIRLCLVGRESPSRRRTRQSGTGNFALMNGAGLKAIK